MESDVTLLLCLAALGISASTVGGFIMAILVTQGWIRLRDKR